MDAIVKMPYLTPEFPTGNKTVTVTIPDTMMPLFVGALSNLLPVCHWEQYGAMSPEQCSQVVSDIIDSIIETQVEMTYPDLVHINPLLYTDSAGPITRSGIGNNEWWSYVYTDGQINRYLEYKVWLGQGHYDLIYINILASNRGIVRFDLDGDFIGFIDCYYNSSGIFNIQYVINDVSVVGDGNHILRLSSSDKNPASNGYFIVPEAIIFKRI